MGDNNPNILLLAKFRPPAQAFKTRFSVVGEMVAAGFHFFRKRGS